MQNKQYTFEEQKKIGDNAESLVEKYLSQSSGLNIQKVDSYTEQLKGIDFLISKKEEKPITIEVKIDNICHKNGRYFLEIELVKANGQHSKGGWVSTTQSDYLFLLVGKTNSLKVVKPDYLRNNIYRWQRAYGLRECYNKSGYSSIGICVPFAMIKGLCVDITESCNPVLDYLYSN